MDNVWKDDTKTFDGDDGKYVCYAVQMTINGINNTKIQPAFLVRIFGEGVYDLDDFINASKANPTILFAVILVIIIIIYLIRRTNKN